MTDFRNMDPANDNVLPFSWKQAGMGVDLTPPAPRVIAVTSGKGGVGKTSVVANIGVFLSDMGRKTVILDADLSLGNLDLLMGVSTNWNLSHVIQGKKTISEVAVSLSGTLRILPAPSGVQELVHLTGEQRAGLLSDLDRLMNGMDVLLIDTAAGISSNVTWFNAAARDIIVVVTPEPAAITDAYALMKVMALHHDQRRFLLLVNQAAHLSEAEEVHFQLAEVAERFLDARVEFFGHVLCDEEVRRAIRSRRSLARTRPDSRAGRCYCALARRIAFRRPDGAPGGPETGLGGG